MCQSIEKLVTLKYVELKLNINEEPLYIKQIWVNCNYLKITGLRVGLLLNFKHAKLEWERIIL